MTFIEFVGMVITIAAVIFMVVKHFFAMLQERRDPEEYAKREKQREDNLRRLLQASGIDLRLDEAEKKRVKQQPKQVAAKPQPPVQVRKSPPAPLFDYQTRPQESYEVIRIEKVSAGKRLLGSLKSPRDMFVIKEILDKPLSMRDEK